ncbi:CD209 antigen-like protein A isoform X2 [Convolutriloba macropyga]|uniref:CD209 antigen-like protein A isoform X2 n=1 Tax=Convolutriloba macropyga TaxID=536237 RepID=UPI003F521E1F
MLTKNSFEILVCFVICLASVVWGCPSNGFTLVTRCFAMNETESSWTKAADDCKNSGGKLFEPKSAEEVTLIYKHFNHTDWAWVGIVYAQEDITMFDQNRTLLSKRKWIYASNMQEIDDSLWAVKSPEPNNSGGHEFCGSVGSKKNGLNDLKCSLEKAYICEF